MNTTIKWTGAILLSLLAHAGATQLFEPNEKPPEQALIAGGEAMEVAVLGNAFEETVLAGDPSEVDRAGRSWSPSRSSRSRWKWPRYRPFSPR